VPRDPRRPREPRARAPRARAPLLPPEKRVAEVARIVGKEWRDSVAGILPVLAEMQREAADARARERSAHDKQLSKRFAAAVRRITRVVDESHLRDDPEVRSRLDFFFGFSVAWTHRAAIESERPRRSADAKALAAEVAVFVCRQCGIELTTTTGGAESTRRSRASKLCRTAAALYGDLGADMSHHCRAALKAEARHRARAAAATDGGASAKPRAE
jgi:hypothetical protein